ncbi:universal stress protein [Actinoallomurus soli]|uniref:universal stress protein n=1 Tax=Actinoallomurus soli TaxID=2952535 RepID=UPI002091EEF6|nr:universal stress protein [Actinoallomurus soli]MCO5974983.1 universal stress protein [Actinoallomurus soli]
MIAYVDGTPSGDEAVVWAIEEAGRRGVVVRVLPRREPDRLLAEAADAAMIVVGSTGFLAMSRLATGSTAMEVAVRADVPVVVIRPGLPDAAPGPSTGRVVAGVDGTALSEAAIRFAFAEADDRECGLTLVHAVDREEDREAGEAALTRLAGERPDVRMVVRAGLASRILIDESAGAELLVIGSRGRAGLSGMLLGSVSQAVVHRAHCPVAVVRAPPG